MQSATAPRRAHGSAGVDPPPLRELSLLTAKPFLHVFDIDEEELADEARIAELRELVAPAEAILMDAKIEAELAELPDEEAAELLAAVGQDEPGLHQLARVGFATLGLQTYLTAGPKRPAPGPSRSAPPPRRRVNASLRSRTHR